MATVPAQVAPEVSQQTATPRYQSIDATPANPGPGIGGGLIALGQGAQAAGDFFSQAAVDDTYNSLEEQTTKILYGDPSVKVKNENGELVPDTGYMGLRGRHALDAREATEKKIAQLRRELSGGLRTLKQDSNFDRISRRYNTIIDGQIGNHARTQSTVYATNVNKASANLALGQIAGAQTEEQLTTGLDSLVAARVRQAQLDGGGPELIQEAEQSARRDGLTAHIQSVGTSDPARAMRMIERNKGMLGVNYDNLYNSMRARADQQVGTEAADRLVGGATSLENGADTLATLRQFEGFRNTAYWDVNHHRVGYGSDTVTRADGTVEKVTKDTVITKEDAERDLVRRAEQSQAQVRNAVGQEAWDKLDARAKSSLTSVAYNYGKLPDSVVSAVKTGDPERIAGAIEALSSHNGGVNARRRAIEAANVRGMVGPEGRPSLGDQSEILSQIDADPTLSPQAKAAATAQVSRLYNRSRDAAARQKVAFESEVNDSSAEAMQTGATTKPIPESRFLQQYGDITGPVKYQEYVNNVQFGADRHAFETMSDQEIQQTIDARIPQPGTAGYANQIGKVDRLRKYADELSKQRRDDPAGAVSRQDIVKDAMKQYDPKKPETFAQVADARRVAQEALGIEPEYQSPITKAEALKLTTPLTTNLGNPLPVLRQMGTTFQQMFGSDAERAFAYALRARKVDTETAQAAASLVKKLALNQPILPSDASALDAAKGEDAANKAITGTPPLSAFGFDTPAAIAGQQPPSVEGSPVITPPTVPPAAIRYLLGNPGSAQMFDQKYGTGRAKEILKKYGAGVPAGANE